MATPQRRIDFVNGELDDLFVEDVASVHIERMDGKQIWMRLYLRRGAGSADDDVVIWLSSDGKLTAMVEGEEREGESDG